MMNKTKNRRPGRDLHTQYTCRLLMYIMGDTNTNSHGAYHKENKSAGGHMHVLDAVDW